jgi:hypothetical protein
MKTKKEHEEFLKIAEWDDVAEILVDLEQHRHRFKNEMTKQQLQDLDEIIELYDNYRAVLLDKISKETSFNRTMGLEIKEAINEMTVGTELSEDDDVF